MNWGNNEKREKEKGMKGFKGKSCKAQEENRCFQNSGQNVINYSAILARLWLSTLLPAQKFSFALCEGRRSWETEVGIGVLFLCLRKDL